MNQQSPTDPREVIPLQASSTRVPSRDPAVPEAIPAEDRAAGLGAEGQREDLRGEMRGDDVRGPALPSPPSGGAAAEASPSKGLGRAAKVGGVVLLFHALVAAWALWPSRAPEERLASAARERDRSEREAVLEGFGVDEGASVEQLVRAAELLIEVDGFTTLRTIARELQRLAPKDLRGHLWEARAELALHMFPEAHAALERASRVAPDDVRPILLRAELYELSGDLDGAAQALSEAWELGGLAPELGLRYGVLLSHAGRLEEAAAILSRLEDPSILASTRTELGLVLYRQGRLDGARALLELAVEGEPESASAHHALGTVCFALGESQRAEAAWRRADALEPSEPRHLAALCELLGRDPARARDATTLANLFKRRFPVDVSRIGGACLTPRALRQPARPPGSPP